MAAYNLVISAYKNGTVDAETITIALDDATDIGKSVRLTTPEGVQVGARLKPGSTTLRLDIDSIAEYND